MKNKDLNKSLNDLYSRIENDQVNYDRQLITQYLKSLEQVKVEVGRLYERYGDQIAQKSYTNLGRLNDIRGQLNANIKRILKEQFEWDIEFTKNVLRDVYSLSYNFIPGVLESSLGVGIRVSVLPENAIIAAVRNDYGKIKWVESAADNINALNEAVKTQVTQGIIQGKTYGESANELNNIIDVGRNKSLRIVRTETHRIQNQGINDGLETTNKSAKLLGLEVEKFWQHNSKRDPRSNHIKMDGQVADEKGMFHFTSGDNAGKKTPGPGLSGIAEEDINCGCTIGIRIKNL